jgi:hypothetical protein
MLVPRPEAWRVVVVESGRRARIWLEHRRAALGPAWPAWIRQAWCRWRRVSPRYRLGMERRSVSRHDGLRSRVAARRLLMGTRDAEGRRVVPVTSEEAARMRRRLDRTW